MTVTAFLKKTWDARCIKGDTGKPLPILANALLALQSDPAVKDALAYDEMLRSAMLVHEIGNPLLGLPPAPLRDNDVAVLTAWLQRAGLKRISTQVVHDAAVMRAHECSYHPVLDYLEALKWDGQRRSNIWLTTK